MLPWLADSYRARPSSPAPRPVVPARLAGGLALSLAAFALTLFPVVPRDAAKTEIALCLANLAANYYQEGDTARAIATYEEALSTQPGNAEVAADFGIIVLGRNDVGRALQLFSDAARSEPSNPSYHAYLGKIHRRQGRLDAARVEFRKAIGLAPERVEVRFELARTLQQLDSYPQALAQYDTMLQLAPDNPSVRHNFAVCLHHVGRLTEARAQLEAARRLGGPVNPQFDSLLRTGRDPIRR
jgi:Flp pilus assembly protein TadD